VPPIQARVVPKLRTFGLAVRLLDPELDDPDEVVVELYEDEPGERDEPDEPDAPAPVSGSAPDDPPVGSCTAGAETAEVLTFAGGVGAGAGDVGTVGTGTTAGGTVTGGSSGAGTGTGTGTGTGNVAAAALPANETTPVTPTIQTAARLT
jgi:hypothetical protein